MSFPLPTPRFWTLAWIVWLAAGPAFALDPDDLRRYGFSRGMSDEVQDSRRLDIPVDEVEASVPTPVRRGDMLDPSAIPNAPDYRARVIRQRQDLATPNKEGYVAPFPGEEKVRAEEGTWKEVEDFFFRPSRIHDRILSMNESGLTGLLQMHTAMIPRPGTTYARLGGGYTFYDRSSGTNLVGDQGIESFTLPVTYMAVPWKNLELSLQGTMINEEASNFPLVQDYSAAGLRDVGIRAKYRFLDNPNADIQAAFGFGMNIGVERVTTRIGSNAVDYSMFLSASKRIHNLGFHATGGFIFPNGETRTNSGVPSISHFDFGVDFQPSERLSFVGEINYLDWNFAGTKTEATVGFKYKMSETWTLDFGAPLQINNDLFEGWRYRVLGSIQAQL